MSVDRNMHDIWQDNTGNCNSISSDSPHTNVTKSDSPISKYPDLDELPCAENIPLTWDMDSSLGTEVLTRSNDELGMDVVSFKSNILVENYDFDILSAHDLGLLYSTDFDDYSLGMCTIEFDDTLVSMFSSPYLTFRHTRPLPGSPSNNSAVLNRQSPFIQTPDSRLGGNPLGRYMLLENIRSYLTILSQPNSSSPYIHGTALEVAGEVSEVRSRSETINMCCTVATWYSDAKETSTPLLGTIGEERKRMDENVSNHCLQWSFFYHKLTWII